MGNVVRIGSIRAAALVLALAGSTLSASSAPATDGCALVHVPAVGPACRTEDGLWKVPLGPGRWVTTHGADPVPRIANDIPVSGVGAKIPKEIGGWPLSRPDCVTDPTKQFHHHVIYARAQDRPDDFADLRNGVRIMVYGSNGWLQRTSALYGREMSYRVLCAGGEVTVTNVKLAIDHENAHFYGIVTDLIRQGFSSPFAKYWIFYDGPPEFGAAGVGTFRTSDSPSADNPNNYGPGWAVTYNVGLFGALRTMMHENGHNLGAVQRTSPNSNQVGHCIDGLDVMCYFEEQGRGPLYRPHHCRIQEYDCKGNDYFNPRPAKRSYLATHWNTGSPVNRFLAGCVYATGALAVPGAAAAPVPGVSTADVKIPSACRGRPFAVSAVPQFPAQVLTAVSGAVPADQTNYTGVNWIFPISIAASGEARLPDADVCFYKGATQLSCHQRHGAVELAQDRAAKVPGDPARAPGRLTSVPKAQSWESGTIPSTATHARIVLSAGAAAVWVFNAV